jgi:hypothetical protein
MPPSLFEDNEMATQTVTIPNVQLTLEQLIGVVRQLEPDARSKVAEALLADEMDERYVQLIKRLANKRPVTDLTDKDINAEIQAVRRQHH